jgi:hypothetical protein
VQHLLTGRVESVPDVAERVLGHRVCPRTALRWSVHGRDGVRLPTVRGPRRARFTTEAAFRWWLSATSGDPTAAPLPDCAADTLRRLGLSA